MIMFTFALKHFRSLFDVLLYIAQYVLIYLQLHILNIYFLGLNYETV